MIRAWAATVGGEGAGRLREALGAGAGALEAGKLSLAWTGPAPQEREGIIVMVDGALHDLALLRRRHRQSSDVATEAVLALAWRREGTAALEGVTGDFTMLVWDRNASRGWLVRDPLGARGAFLHRGGALRAAGELHHLLRILLARPAPDRDGVLHWMTDTVRRGPRTLFEGVTRLEPAYVLSLEDGRARPRRWWTPPAPGTEHDARTADEAAEAIRLEASAAVARRLPERGGGVLLSGGFDSGSVAAFAAAAGRQLHAFSAVFPEHPRIDEDGLIHAVADATCSGATRLEVRTAGALDAAAVFSQATQMPLFSPNFHFMRELMGTASRQGHSVLLDGEGGDELFGLEPALLADRIRRGRLVSAVGLARRLPGAGSPTPWRPALGALRTHGLIGALPPRIERAERRRRARRRPPEKPWLLQSAARSLIEAQDPGAWKTAGVPRWRAHLEDVLCGMRDDIGVGQLLRLQAELSGVELRHPLLHDAKLTSLMLTLPAHLAFDAEHDRPLARKALAGLLPDVVRLRRDKTLFDTFVFDSLTGPDLGPIRALLSDPSSEINGWVDPVALRRELVDVDPHRHPRGLRSWVAEAWRLATVEIWLRL